MISPDERELILAAIDRFQWKHSWHLPRDSSGHYVDWYNPATLTKCRTALEEYRTMCLTFACTCDKLVGRLTEEQTAIAAEEREEQEAGE